MPIATGVKKELRYKKETTWGTIAGTSGGQKLRRLQSNINLNKATYRSNEIRTDQQRADFRHGSKSVEGTISGELSVGTWNDFMASALRQGFQTAATTGAAVASKFGFNSSGPTGPGGADSFLTAGFKVGDVIRATGYATASLNNRNFLVTNVTATQITGAFVDGTANATEAASAGATVQIVVQGKKTWVPTSGHTDDSYTLEHWFSDIAQSERYTGCKVSQVSVNLPATGMGEIEFTFMGKDMEVGTAAYFTAPAATSTGSALAAVNGALYVGGTKYATVTGVQFTINGNMSAGEVVGSTTTPDIFEGSVDVSGQITCYFENATLRDLFKDETESSVSFVMTANNDANAPFVAFTLPRIKAGGSQKDDGEKGLIQTMPFTALLKSDGGSGTAYDQTTIVFQDSSAA